MTLAEDVKRVHTNFDSVDTVEFLDVLSRIQQKLRTPDTRAYLEKKITAVRSAQFEERKELCRKLMPYLAWHMSGANS